MILVWLAMTHVADPTNLAETVAEYEFFLFAAALGARNRVEVALWAYETGRIHTSGKLCAVGCLKAAQPPPKAADSSTAFTREHPASFRRVLGVLSEAELPVGTTLGHERRRTGESGLVVLAYPFSGRWLTRTSPAHQVSSHATHLMGTTYAIDFIAVDQHGHSAPWNWRVALGNGLAAIHARRPGVRRRRRRRVRQLRQQHPAAPVHPSDRHHEPGTGTRTPHRVPVHARASSACRVRDRLDLIPPSLESHRRLLGATLATALMPASLRPVHEVARIRLTSRAR